MMTPSEMRAAVKAPKEVLDNIARWRDEVKCIMRNADGRKLVVVGPCSIHDYAGAIEYAERLKALQEDVQNELLLVMRVYCEKPRTTSGWKGFVHDPNMDGSDRMDVGLYGARELLKAINELGVPCAVEALDPVISQYLEDLVTWTAIGARTVESQTHRELASALPSPVGFKNGTSGAIGVAVDAMCAARTSHTRLTGSPSGRAIYHKTKGNRHTSVVLRGGRAGPNYQVEHVENAISLMRSMCLYPAVMVDCSHANAQSNYKSQIPVAAHVAGLMCSTSELYGLMLESNIEGGKQEMTEEVIESGISVTDPCLGWEDTEYTIKRVAGILHEYREARGKQGKVGT